MLSWNGRLSAEGDAEGGAEVDAYHEELAWARYSAVLVLAHVAPFAATPFLEQLVHGEKGAGGRVHVLQVHSRLNSFAGPIHVQRPLDTGL